MGITVTGKSAETAGRAPARRSLRLVARVDRESTASEPAYAYTLANGRVRALIASRPDADLETGRTRQRKCRERAA
jgi:hypothetical protein